MKFPYLSSAVSYIFQFQSTVQMFLLLLLPLRFYVFLYSKPSTWGPDSLIRAQDGKWHLHPPQLPAYAVPNRRGRRQKSTKENEVLSCFAWSVDSRS